MTQWNRPPGIPRKPLGGDVVCAWFLLTFLSPTAAYAITFTADFLIGASEFVVTSLAMTAGLSVISAPTVVVGALCFVRIGLGKKLGLIVLALIAFSIQYLIAIIVFGLIALSHSGFEGVH